MIIAKDFSPWDKRVKLLSDPWPHLLWHCRSTTTTRYACHAGSGRPSGPYGAHGPWLPPTNGHATKTWSGLPATAGWADGPANAARLPRYYYWCRSRDNNNNEGHSYKPWHTSVSVRWTIKCQWTNKQKIQRKELDQKITVGIKNVHVHGFSNQCHRLH